MRHSSYSDPSAITTDGLTKAYGATTVVDDLTVSVPTGSITRFIGRNGAGKTTTLRMLLGLVTPTSGTATVLGEPITAPNRYLPSVGALIEGPAFHPALSARDNLRVLTRVGRLDDRRIDDMLDIARLTERANDRYRSYSLGMKQRLGLAAGLLIAPRLLVLDEPTNGLDPPGIAEMRELLTDLAAGEQLVSGLTSFADWFPGQLALNLQSSEPAVGLAGTLLGLSFWIAGLIAIAMFCFKVRDVDI